ncbi:MAG: hypothetical protein KAW49_05875, partial [Anaerolineae bacterium]|nr:hypothetical protein [Anaerolineae bacterium]
MFAVIEKSPDLETNVYPTGSHCVSPTPSIWKYRQISSQKPKRELLWPDRGYIRIKVSLSNGDFLEAAEYFVLEDGDCITRRYRYQWMDGERRELHKRWDNVEHYPDLSNFPHHVHVGNEENVESGESLSII